MELEGNTEGQIAHVLSYMWRKGYGDKIHNSIDRILQNGGAILPMRYYVFYE
jgi:hypothetical protein